MTSAVTKLSFTEEMKGFVTLGERDYDRGYRQGRETETSFMFHLTITVHDVDGFIARAEHDTEDLVGYVECPALGGRLPVERGKFNLFVDGEDATRKLMLYRLLFTDKDGRNLTMSGFKDVKDDSGLDVWADTTTLFIHLYEGHIDLTRDDVGKVPDVSPESIVGSGIIHIYFFDFMKQLTTFHTEGATLSERNAARLNFCRLFFGKLWDVYGVQVS